MSLDPAWAIAITALAASLGMLFVWLRQLRTQDAGTVDLVWTLGVGGAGLLHCLGADGWGPRRLLVAALVAAWSLRLARHLAARLRAEQEDGRYAEMRRRLGARANAWFFAFFQIQALLVVLLGLVFLVLARAELAGWRWTDALAILLYLAALGGESIADRQLARWRADPLNSRRTCRAGLWRHSRHPNYFFEWLHWLVYPVLGLGLPLGWTLWLAPLLMLFLILRVTGIPPTEAQALRKRGDDYRAYQRTTNAFFPGPVRGERAAPR